MESNDFVAYKAYSKSAILIIIILFIFDCILHIRKYFVIQNKDDINYSQIAKQSSSLNKAIDVLDKEFIPSMILIILSITTTVFYIYSLIMVILVTIGVSISIAGATTQSNDISKWLTMIGRIIISCFSLGIIMINMREL